MRHVTAVAGRELQSLFVSPVAYVVLALWAILAAVFFLSGLGEFSLRIAQAQQFQNFEALRDFNLNDHLLTPFIASMWLVLLFTVPAVTMGLFANEKSNGTQELLLTCPLSIWEIVVGKFLAAAAFVLVMVAVLAFFPAILFLYGDPEVGKTASALLGLFLMSLTFVAVGAFSSSLTQHQLIAFLLTLVIILVLMILPYITEIAAAGSPGGSSLLEGLRWLSPGEHYFERVLVGLVDTRDLAYFGIVIAGFLLLTKTTVESVRWR
ncbi:MAG: ABC transporter permease [Proteobacteria bacterium]|nr:ABC transporter permease [Pseudomonadota bacterium]